MNCCDFLNNIIHIYGYETYMILSYSLEKNNLEVHKYFLYRHIKIRIITFFKMFINCRLYMKTI